MKMYLPLHSFNARRKHEGRYKYAFTVDEESLAIDVISEIKEYNKGKDVFYTCAKVGDENKRYSNNMWLFSYANRIDRNVIVHRHSLITIGHKMPLIEGVNVCPFTGEI
jgi:hypothetical protein